MTKRKCFLCFLISQLVGGALTAAPAGEYANRQLLIETSELASILSNADVRLLDARPAAEYRLGHVPGAVSFPAPATEDLEANRQGYPLPPATAEQLMRMAGINTASRVVIYDDQGNRFAARVFYFLEFFGHSRVRVLNGGFRKWQSEGRPTSTENPRVPPGDFALRPNGALIATSPWVAAHLSDPSVKLVDARSAAEYVAGHIPGAVHLDWTRTLAPGDIKTFLPAVELQQLFAEARVTHDQEAVTYCQMGVRAAEVYFVLRLLGYPRVRVYDGSWEDWSANPALPVEK